MAQRAVKSLNRKEYTVLIRLLTDARNRSGLSQRDLAKLADLPQPAISDIEAGKRRVDLIELMDIATAIGLEPVEFLEAFFAAIRSE